jgi:hypothetical protein
MKLINLILSCVLCLSFITCNNENRQVPDDDGQSDFAYENFITDLLVCMNMPRPADSYDYPVYPGMEEWASFKTGKEMQNACQIPVEVLRNMSTQAVIQAIWEYPLLTDVIHRYEYQLDFESVFESNNAYMELMQRQDAGIMLLERLQWMDPLYSNRLSAPYVLEILMSQKVFLMQLENNGRKKIIEAALKNDDLRKHNESVYSFRSTAWLLIGRTLFAYSYAPFLQEIDRNQRLKSFLEDRMYVYLEEEADAIPSFIIECAKSLFNK